MKRTFLSGICAAAVIGAFSVMTPTSVDAAPKFTCSTAQLIVPWKAGGGTHILFSIFENTINKMGVEPKIKVVSIGGQGGNKGAKKAHGSKADGCTLFAIHQSAFTSYLNGRIDYHYDGFDMVAKLTSTADIVGANKDAPYKDFNELKKAAIDAPETILTGATFGSTSQFMWLLMEDLTGMKFKYVPFDGTAQRMTALRANNITLGTLNVASGKKFIESGELKGYAIAAEERSKYFPKMPTLKELGVDLVYALERGIVAPKGTQQDKIDHWSEIFKKAAADPDLLKQMDAKGTDINFVGPKGYEEWYKKTYADYEKVAIKIGMYKK